MLTVTSEFWVPFDEGFDAVTPQLIDLLRFLLCHYFYKEEREEGYG